MTTIPVTRVIPLTAATEARPLPGTQNGRPTLNPLIFDLIAWAEMDQRHRDIHPIFSRWGGWEQSSWAWADLSSVPEEHVVPLGDFEENGEDVIRANETAIRNGLCQTAYCMAGQAVSQGGYRMILDDTRGSVSAEECIKEEFVEYNDRGLAVYMDLPDAEPREISGVAQRILGLDHDELHFFAGDNDISDLKQMVNAFCEARLLPIPYPGAGLYGE